MIMVGHENNVMYEKSIFFNGFGQNREEYPRKLLLHEPKSLIVRATDQMVGVIGLEDTGFACHAGELAGSMPKGSDPGDRGDRATRGHGEEETRRKPVTSDW